MHAKDIHACTYCLIMSLLLRHPVSMHVACMHAQDYIVYILPDSESSACVILWVMYACYVCMQKIHVCTHGLILSPHLRHPVSMHVAYMHARYQPA